MSPGVMGLAFLPSEQLLCSSICVLIDSLDSWNRVTHRMWHFHFLRYHSTTSQERRRSLGFDRRVSTITACLHRWSSFRHFSLSPWLVNPPGGALDGADVSRPALWCRLRARLRRPSQLLGRCIRDLCRKCHGGHELFPEYIRRRSSLCRAPYVQ